MTAEDHGHDHHDRQDGEGVQGEFRAHAEHHRDDAHEEQGIGHDVDDPIAQELLKDSDVIDDP